MKTLTVAELVTLAKDPDVSPEKLSQIIAYNDNLRIEQAKAAFRKAFAKLQAELPIIEKNETITYRDGRVGSYAANDAIQEIVGPICRKHGFTLSFEVRHNNPDFATVVGCLTHKGGHQTFSEYESRADMSGGKTTTQGLGSVQQYGIRYTTVALLNLIQRGADNDGKQEVEVDNTPKPEGYEEFARTLVVASAGGTWTLNHAWRAGTEAQRLAVPQHGWDNLKQVAKRVDDAVL